MAAAPLFAREARRGVWLPLHCSMGSESSTLLYEPWRDVPKIEESQDFIGTRDFKDVKALRILLHGPVGVGKSSFINSANSVLQGKITVRALTDAATARLFTRTCQSYEVPCTPGSSYSLSFTDVMGFESNEGSGVCVQDLILAMKGHIKDGYLFSPKHPITENHPLYNKSPTKADKIHVLVSVFAAHTGTVSIYKNLRAIRLEASELGIPQIAIITKVDQACPEVQNNLKNIYRSRVLKEKVDSLNIELGLQRNCIFLVKNYESELKTSPEVDAPILCALRQIVSLGEDFLNDLES